MHCNRKPCTWLLCFNIGVGIVFFLKTAIFKEIIQITASANTHMHDCVSMYIIFDTYDAKKEILASIDLPCTGKLLY